VTEFVYRTPAIGWGIPTQTKETSSIDDSTQTSSSGFKANLFVSREFARAKGKL